MSRNKTSKFIIRRDDDKLWRWTLLSSNLKVVAISSKGYSDKAGCLYNCRHISALAQDAPIWNAQDDLWEVTDRELFGTSIR